MYELEDKDNFTHDQCDLTKMKMKELTRMKTFCNRSCVDKIPAAYFTSYMTIEGF